MNGVDQGKSLGKIQRLLSNLDFQRLKIRIRRLVKYIACGQAYIWNPPANYVAIIVHEVFCATSSGIYFANR